MPRFCAYSVLPGFRLTFGLTIFYASAVILLPLAALVSRAAGLGPAGFLEEVTAPRARAAFSLSLMASFAAAAIDAVFGFVAAWVLVRYRFPGRRLLDSLVDLPFALPTAVSGIALTVLFSERGFMGKLLGVEVSYTRVGIVIALAFIGLPFLVRTMEPAIRSLSRECEEAAATLGASRLATFRRVTLPALLPALGAGFALAFGRALGEYGSVVFIAGNMPMKTEILPLLVVVELEQYDYAGAAALGTGMLCLSFLVLLGLHLLTSLSRRRAGTER